MTENKWYRSTGQDGDVVISTRVRLARNLPRLPFPACMNTEQKRQAADAILKALPEKAYRVIDMHTLPHITALSLVERI